MTHFSFQNLEVWQLAFKISNTRFDIADKLEQKGLFRFAEQLSGAGMSLTNNIAEGSGLDSKKEFAQFLNFTRRSTFECANVLLTLGFRKLITPNTKNEIFQELDLLSRKITTFKRTLRQNS